MKVFIHYLYLYLYLYLYPLPLCLLTMTITFIHYLYHYLYLLSCHSILALLADIALTALVDLLAPQDFPTRLHSFVALDS